uniref:Uncharacterized protein n=1 Tax=Lactuca sativa TaxID=4236 RepID=A0A9R1WL34_LACSA|nr:hypothetical protein LSAT_V11C100021420 [Lactuca sativa]
MLVQPFLAMQQPWYHFTQQTPNQDCLTRSVTSPFIKELLEYEIPNTVKLPHLKTYYGTTNPDSHTNTYKWTMTSLKLDERFWFTYFHTTLDGNAGTWFKTLLPGSISNFSQLKTIVPETHGQATPNNGRTKGVSGTIPTPRRRRSLEASISQCHEILCWKTRPPPYSLSRSKVGGRGRTHDTINCSVLRDKFDAENPKDDDERADRRYDSPIVYLKRPRQNQVTDCPGGFCGHTTSVRTQCHIGADGSTKAQSNLIKNPWDSEIKHKPGTRDNPSHSLKGDQMLRDNATKRHIS